MSNLLKKDAFGIVSLRENGILKTDTKEKATICNRQFQSAFTREGDSDPPSKGASPFSPMGDITVDPKGVAKLLDGLNVHKAPGPDGLNARVLKECSNEISPILALIFNESLARGDVPDEWRQATVIFLQICFYESRDSLGQNALHPKLEVLHPIWGPL